jgi:hypothetical protein
MLHRHRHVQCEGAAGLALAIGAIAGVEQQRKSADLVTDRTALAAAGHGKNGFFQCMIPPASQRSKDYPETAACEALFVLEIRDYRFSITRLWMARPK